MKNTTKKIYQEKKGKTVFNIVRDNSQSEVLISLGFLIPYTKENAYASKLYINYIKKGTMNYDLVKYKLEMMKLYAAKIYATTKYIGNYICLSFELQLLSKNSLPDKDEEILEKAIDIFKETIYNPYLKDGVFEKNRMDKCKKELLLDLETLKYNKRAYAVRVADKLFDRYGRGEIFECPTKIINDLTADDMEDLYQKLCAAKIDVTIVGDVDEKEIAYLEDELLLGESIGTIQYKEVPKSSYQEISFEDTECDQAVLIMTLQIMNYKKEDTLKYEILKSVLRHGIFDIVREKNSLSYYSYADWNIELGIIELVSGVLKENVQLAKNITKDSLKKIVYDDLTQEKLDIIKKNLIEQLQSLDDDNSDLLSYFRFIKIVDNKNFDFENIKNLINSINVKDIKAVADNLALINSFVLGGTFHD